jgi:hypothetical protein
MGAEQWALGSCISTASTLLSSFQRVAYIQTALQPPSHLAHFRPCFATDLQNQASCLDTPACWQPALDQHLAIFPDHDAAWEAVQQQAGEVDAWVLLEEPQCVQGPLHSQQEAQEQEQEQQEEPDLEQQQKLDQQLRVQHGRIMLGGDSRKSWSWAGSSNSSSRSSRKHVHSASNCHSSGSRAAGAGAGAANLLPLQYTIRMNHSDVPPPGLRLDMFDVSPGTMPLPGNLLW